MTPIPDLEPVVSTNVAAIGYDDSAEELYVEYLNTGLYSYSGVPMPIWLDLQGAPSKGEFMNQVIKPTYPAQKL